MRTLFVIFSMLSLVVSGYSQDIVSEPFVGVTHIHRTLTSPRPLNINIVVIDLSAEGISFRVTPPNGEANGEANAQKMTDFISSQGAQIGINCGFFFWNSNINGYDIMGYSASDGDIYSLFVAYAGWPSPYVSLNISSTNVPTMIYPRDGYPLGSYYYPRFTEIYNAAPGSEWIVKNGVNVVDSTWEHSSQLHPRTAGGYTSDSSQLILMTVDGRQSGFSEGMTISEVADELIGLGVYQGINFDGGGSTAMAFADPMPRLVNVPINGGVAYEQRLTPNNLAVFAQLNTEVEQKVIYNDFENGDEGTFAYSPGYSGSTQGIISASSTAEPVDTDSWLGDWCENIVIVDDATQTGVSEYPDGGWFVRWVSGSSASPSQNYPRTTQGNVGLWAKTETQGLKMSICIDNDSQMERGLPVHMISDGYWHCYQWPLEDNSQWEGWINGDGFVTGSVFTLDSIQIFGPDADAQLQIDTICHDMSSSLDVIDNCGQVWKAGQGMLSDLNKDCIVDEGDMSQLAQDWLNDNPENDIVIVGQNSIIDILDLAYMAYEWLEVNDPQLLQ